MSGCTLWTPEAFREELDVLAAHIADIDARHVYLATVPHVTIPPITRGMMKDRGCLPEGERYFDYYTRFFIRDKEFRPERDKHLTKAEAIEIDAFIDAYNELLVAEATRRGWHLVDMCGVLDRLAVRRNHGKPTYPMPPELSDLSLRFFEIRPGGGVKSGGLIGLDGVHPTGAAADVCREFKSRRDFLNGSGSVALAMKPHLAPRVIVEGSTIGVAFFDKKTGEPRALPAATKIRLRMGGGKSVAIDPTDDNYKAYFLPPQEPERGHCIPLGHARELRDGLRSLRDGNPIVVEVENGTAVAARYARRKNAWDAYGLNLFYNGWIGMWFPVGLVASNLKTTDGSLDFSAMPIGVALGGRWWLENDFYLGFSAVANWSISSVGEGSADGAMGSDKVTKVDGLGVGALLDVGGLFYLGSVYVADFGGDDPGFMATIGMGPGLIELLTELRPTGPSE
jgi:hypothetical protein